MENERKTRKVLIDILDRGILDLNEFGIITNTLIRDVEVEAADRVCNGCDDNCGCKRKCLCLAGEDIREMTVNPMEYRSKEVEEVMKKIIAAYGPK